MSASEFQPFAEFIDDYFVECDEHLAVAQRTLLALEPLLSESQLDLALLDELFRGCHSIKGLSAMVGVREAERLAHQMESYLGALRKGSVTLSSDGLEALMLGVKTLEQVVVAKRNRTPPPDIEPLLASFNELVTKESASPGTMAASSDSPDVSQKLGEGKHLALEAAVAKGAQVYRFRFAPTAALAERGINVNVVRQRLEELGKVIDAAPLLVGEGQIAFSFIVACPKARQDWSEWAADGITVAPYEPPSPHGPSGPDGISNAGSATAATVPAASSPARNIVRVDLARLDSLMRMVGELVISRARLESRLGQTESVLPPADWRFLQETNQAIERQLRDLREGIMQVRMVPIGEVFSRMRFVVRDLAHEQQKKVVLTLHGQETEIDKFIVERIMDPLLHLVRNAVSHGLEPATERVTLGKPAEGRLDLSARVKGESIEIEVADDGRGIDGEKVVTRAMAAGLVGPQTVIDASSVLDVICAEGFSTQDAADRASGRGMGMSVVRGTVEELGGTLTLETSPGHGTRFLIQLPLTLSIADALIVLVGGQTFAVPQVAVREVIEVEGRAVSVFENNEVILYREGALPLVRLPAFFGLQDRSDRDLCVLVLGEGRNAVGLGVDRVVGLREVVVRPLTDPLVRVPGVAGATELGDGRIILILDTLTFTRAAIKQPRRKPEVAAQGTPALSPRTVGA